ncbi:hypothetical protein [Halorhabdus salina]|uniref:hypothetical protein n=1 Tax=Halorhabdus salina TaxID=2750670 RepID=UPI00215D999C|nr:hypothetical protein [Halorhabdus salina]
MQRRVKATAERVGEETGDSDWQKVSSHDLRRYYAQSLLVRERMNLRVVWKSGVVVVLGGGTVSECANS